ncbi:MAG: hypothetical protein CMJ78_14320 [Planctomycetaceae bacterium]|nr:hypothetical protein [Planctomycetaceae bacterium]
MTELRTIEMFNAALESDDLDGLRAASSNGFDEKALRRSDALKDFRVLRLPDGKTSVINVDDISESEKRVTVEVGERKRKVKYTLLKDQETQKWVVDDIHIRQSRNGVTAAKSVTDQMDLLLAVRELIDAWQTGSRPDVLSAVTSDFADILRELPPTYLAKITSRTMGAKSNSDAKPDAQLDESVAVVRLPRSTGQMIIEFRRENDRWKVSDMAAESRQDKNHISSVKQLAQIASVTHSFLAAYEANDKSMLKHISVPSFFKGSLAPADLSQVKLPGSDLGQDDYYINMEGGRPNVIVKQASDVVKISLRKMSAKNLGEPDQFLVDEVTIYELDGTEEKRLSAIFTGRAILRLFSEAIAKGDLQTIRHSSTQDFNDRIWKNISSDIWPMLATDDIESAVPEVVSTVYNGATTEITVTQGSKALTYVMQDKDGVLLVDDVLVPTIDRPSSLKRTLELTLPVVLFRYALMKDDLRLVQRTSSKDFNHMIWHQVKQIPKPAILANDFFMVPLKSVKQDDNQTLVHYGTQYRGAKVRLIREHGFFLVDQIELINGLDASQRSELKHALRLKLAKDASDKVRAAREARSLQQQQKATQPHEPLESGELGFAPSDNNTTKQGFEFQSPMTKSPSKRSQADPFGSAEITDSYTGETTMPPASDTDPFTPITIPE